MVNWVALTKDKQVLKMWIIESGNCDAIIFNEKLGLICKPSSSLARQTSETHTRGTITNFAWCNIVLGACLHPHLPTTPTCFPTHSKAFHLKYITFIIYLCSNMLSFPPYMGWIGVCLVAIVTQHPFFTRQVRSPSIWQLHEVIVDTRHANFNWCNIYPNQF